MQPSHPSKIKRKTWEPRYWNQLPGRVVWGLSCGTQQAFVGIVLHGVLTSASSGGWTGAGNAGAVLCSIQGAAGMGLCQKYLETAWKCAWTFLTLVSILSSFALCQEAKPSAARAQGMHISRCLLQGSMLPFMLFLLKKLLLFPPSRAAVPAAELPAAALAGHCRVWELPWDSPRTATTVDTEMGGHQLCLCWFWELPPSSQLLSASFRHHVCVKAELDRDGSSHRRL